MKTDRTPLVTGVGKAPTGISGFDTITGGGLPLGRTTLLVGGPGSGKTVFALQFLVNGVQQHNEPGIFVAFEESSQRILDNASGFGWKLKPAQRKKLHFLNAQPQPDLVQSGDFDFCGLLAALQAQAQSTGARRIVFDALDMVLALLPDPQAQRREIYRLHTWLLARGLTGIITLKADTDDTHAVSQQPFGFMQFMVDCAVILKHSVVQGVSQRSLRVQKFRGSSFDENESPFLIGNGGLEVAGARTLDNVDTQVTTERISSGVERLDTMLGGGYYRGASVLVTGFSGTAKTTLSGAFVQAACQRGERTLFVSFDSEGGEVIRNLASVGIRLAPFVKNGILRMASARTISGSAETYLVRIKALAQEHRARCVVIDPVSTWSKSGTDLNTHSVAERLIDWSKADGTTLLCTRLLDEMSSPAEGSSPLQLSAQVDTWIHLNYLVQAGERNRGLSIIKSRGTAHSNQVRELILSDSGVTLADIYTAGGEVLMGTLRWEKERAERVASEAVEVARKLKRVRLDAEEAELEVRVKSLQTELAAKQIEKALLLSSSKSLAGDVSRDRTRLEELRGADATPPTRSGGVP
ncbi:circadian clock protein KaiC [Rhodoferax sp. AJA081-3]|uniref:circadian clock protein KaiC n=1 Tax=Rhodoferax sp. AJA081-3 TaxID=2752316 RepID=UPI001AE053E1|nr:circadian clock protein KaiC [Rhodoferax sp. AJA081-3]QTN27535.1 circadian clock protein KaiC [Rhodoferax sp. AJA081-3]